MLDGPLLDKLMGTGFTSVMVERVSAKKLINHGRNENWLQLSVASKIISEIRNQGADRSRDSRNTARHHLDSHAELGGIPHNPHLCRQVGHVSNVMASREVDGLLLTSAMSSPLHTRPRSEMMEALRTD
jgi:hypothetical protein